MSAFVNVAIALPIDRLFTYSVPAALAADVALGKRVFVPFAHRRVVGYIVGLTDEPGSHESKPIDEVIDAEPVASAEMLELTRWIKDNYLCAWGEALEAVIPGGIKRGRIAIGSRIKESHIDYSAFARSDPHVLNHEQARALTSIADSIGKGEHRTFLLHGITSSGKTEVYMQAIEISLRAGKGAIMLVPEISLTPQTVERFVGRFGAHVAVIHSRLTAAHRFLEWQRIRTGEARIVVGARSAIFSPLKDLGLIIIDEEHETTYKQDDVPRYHAREVAEERARLNACPLILGSATPSLEAYYRAKKGEYTLIKLTKRIDERLLPKVKIVDMRMELATRRKITIFSKVLLDAVDKALKAGKQVIIFLNRRGFATFVNCKRCGLVLRCPHCATVLVYHFDRKRMICHYCDHETAPPDICPQCRSGYIRYFGLGTERVESEMSRVFPGAKIARMDSDTTHARGSHDRILGDFKAGVSSMLIGTQMIAKGLDIPAVTLVGVVSADVTLNIPDFRASERTFNLLTQVGGRAGRGVDGGEVVIQTYAPGHYSILTAAKHDYEKFYEEEILSRKELNFPPFVSLVKITVRGRDEDAALAAARTLADTIRAHDTVSTIAGPAPAVMAKVRGYFRFNIILKGADRASLVSRVRDSLAGYKRPSGILVAVDVDPMSM